MNRNLMILSAIALLLGAYVAAERLPDGWRPNGSTGEDSAAPAAVSGSAAQAAGARLNPLDGLAADSFAAVLERPLFNPGRAPRPVEPPPPPPPPEEPPPPEAPPPPAGPAAEDFALLAVAGGPSGYVAAIRIAATGEVVYLREGQPIAEWTIISISDRSAVIGTPENNVTLSMFETAAPESAPPSAPDMPTPPPEDMPPPAPPQEMQTPAGAQAPDPFQ
jgi:hypothetical protein